MCSKVKQFPQPKGAVRSDHRQCEGPGGALHNLDMPVVEEERGFTEYHTLLLTTHRLGDAQELADRLEECHIIAGACEMPEELGGGGLRLGVQELTRKGLEEKDAPEIAECIAGALRGQDLPGVKSRVQALARKFSQVRFTIH